MNVLKPHKQTTIFTLLGLGKSQRDIERITGIDRKTIRSYQRLFEASRSNSPGVATDSSEQIPPPRPPTVPVPTAPLSTSKCEPHRPFIDAQLRLGRNAMAIYQDLVDLHGFDGAYNSVKRFAAYLRHKQPEQFDRLSFQPGEEMQVDYGEGALTRVIGTERYRKPRLFVATLRYSRRSFRRVVWKSGQRIWAELHEQAWRYFGGSTRYVVLDSVARNRIQHHVAAGATKVAPRLLVQSCPRLLAGLPHHAPKASPRIAQRHHEQARLAVAIRAKDARQRALAVVDLGLFAGGKLQAVELLGLCRTQTTGKAFDAVVRAGETMTVNQILVDGHVVALEPELRLDEDAVRLTGGDGFAHQSRWPGWGNLIEYAGGHPGGICLLGGKA